MKIWVSDEYLEKFKCSKPFNRGNEGTCYLLGDSNKIIKIFYQSYQPKQIFFDNYKNSQIAFPIDLIYNRKNDIRAYTMNYLSGEKFINGFDENLDLNKLKEAYLKTRILILKFKDIYMDDNCLDNLLYDYELNKINIIDTSRWYERYNGEIENINDFNWQMTTALVRSVDWKSFKLNHDKELYSLYISYKYAKEISSIFIEFLIELEKKVSEYKGNKVKTIKDLKI